MCIFSIILTADPTIGRVNYSSFSDQTLMELLFEVFADEMKRE